MRVGLEFFRAAVDGPALRRSVAAEDADQPVGQIGGHRTRSNAFAARFADPWFGAPSLAQLRSDSINRNVVGNQIGPRQFEFPPFSLQ